MVTLTRAFDLMTTEVTLGMFRAYASATGKTVPDQPDWNTDARQPIVKVNWDESAAFCAWLNGRLPTEAEWEYAARGGLDGARYPWGNEPPGESAGSANGARCRGDASATIGVGAYAPNGFGLYDMAGNVFEWVADWYAPYSGGVATDSRGPSSGERRVVRGGSWFYIPGFLRVSDRGGFPPDIRNGDFGFRCARDVFP